MLTDKIALVTGASRGIGKAIALELGRLGARVVGTATTEAGAKGISDTFSAQKIQGKGLVLDVTDQSSINDTLAYVNAEFGAPTVLINNAGITCDNLMLRMKDEEWDKVINTDLNGVYKVTKACLKGMLKSHWGRIINVSSVVACSGNPGQVNYSAAKAGLIGFSKSLAIEIASRNITVNVIAPGFIDTEMTQVLTETQREQLLARIPAHRMGSPEDIAAAVGFLASPNASYITGTTLHINGGLYMG
ncbi:3-oxoacyl-ACP reductase FabG [soil metagenome]